MSLDIFTNYHELKPALLIILLRRFDGFKQTDFGVEQNIHMFMCYKSFAHSQDIPLLEL